MFDVLATAERVFDIETKSRAAGAPDTSAITTTRTAIVLGRPHFFPAALVFGGIT